jgi:hypothetical protein
MATCKRFVRDEDLENVDDIYNTTYIKNTSSVLAEDCDQQADQQALSNQVFGNQAFGKRRNDASSVSTTNATKKQKTIIDISDVCPTKEEVKIRRQNCIDCIRDMCKTYDISDWRFRIECRSTVAIYKLKYEKKLATISARFIRKASLEQTRSKIADMIAHILVGPEQYGQSQQQQWMVKAIELGGSAAVVPDIIFTKPKYIYSCSLGCFTVARMKHVQLYLHSKCATCGTQIKLT